MTLADISEPDIRSEGGRPTMQSDSQLLLLIHHSVVSDLTWGWQEDLYGLKFTQLLLLMRNTSQGDGRWGPEAFSGEE